MYTKAKDSLHKKKQRIRALEADPTKTVGNLEKEIIDEAKKKIKRISQKLKKAKKQLTDVEVRSFCKSFLTGKCPDKGGCNCLHLQWEFIVKAGYCPLYVVGQCRSVCSLRLKHVRTFKCANDDHTTLKLVSDQVKVKSSK